MVGRDISLLKGIRIVSNPYFIVMKNPMCLGVYNDPRNHATVTITWSPEKRKSIYFDNWASVLQIRLLLIICSWSVES